MQAAKVIQLVYDWTMRRERIQKVLKDADAPGRFLLALIYVSEKRGAAESELLGSLEGFPPSQALMLLGKLEQELLIFSREGDSTRTFHGFREMADFLLPEVLRDQWVHGPAQQAGAAGPEAVNWISYRHFLSAHLCHFLCQVALGSVKITQNGEMHRKDQQELAQRLSFGERLSSAIPGEEVQLLLHFTAQTRLVLQEDGRLYLSEEGKAMLRGDRRDAGRHLLDWWKQSRVRGMDHTLKTLASLPSLTSLSAVRIAPLANLFWIYAGPGGKAGRKGYHDVKGVFTWENLPRVLQELWLLGLVDFGMVKGRLGWIRPDLEALFLLLEEGEPAKPAESANPQPTKPISLPNMESLVPLTSPLVWQHRLELVARKSNDEFMARYRFNKESVIQGLQTGLTMDEFKDLLAWLGFEAFACQTLLDWASTYASTLFMDALVLKVSDPVRFRELQEIPQFVELVTEVIPNYGFVLSRQNKPRVKELLQHFGLVPGEDSRRTLDLEPVILDPAGSAWAFTVPEAGPPAYRESIGSLRAPQAPAADKDAQSVREAEMAQRIETLETAIAGEKKVEFSYLTPNPANPKRVALRPLLLIKHKDPIKLIGIEMDTGHRNEYMLEQVKALRIME